MSVIFRVLMLVPVAIAGVASVHADEPATPIEIEAVTLGRPVDFTKDIVPIFEANCVACHNVAIDEGGLSLEDVPEMLEGGGRGPAVVPGKPDEGWLLAVASHRREPLMPPPENDVEAKPLTPRELGLIKQWILEGAGKGSAPAGSTLNWKALPPHLQAIHSVDLSGDDRFVAVGRGNQVIVYDLPLVTEAGRLLDPNLSELGEGDTRLYPHGAAHRDVVHAIAFHPGGSLLATAGYRSVKLWQRAGIGESQPFDDKIDEKNEVTAIAGSTDGRACAVAVQNDVRLMATPDGQELGRWTAPSNVIAVAVSDDRSLVAAAGDDQTLTVWRTGAAEPVSSRAMPAAVTDVTFLADRLATAHGDGVCRIWSASGEQPERELTGHTGSVRSIVSDASAKRIISAGDDGTARLWDATEGKQLRSIEYGETFSHVAVSPDGNTLAACGDDGTIRFWNLEDGKQVAEAQTGLPARRALAEATETLDWRKQLAAVADTRLNAAEEALKEREEIHAKAVEAREAAAKALEAAKTAEQEAAAAAKTAADQAADKPDDAELKKQAEAATKAADEARAKATEADDALRSAERAIGLAETAVTTMREQRDARTAEKAEADKDVAAAEEAAAEAKSLADDPRPATAIVFAVNGDRVIVSDESDTIQTYAANGRPLDAVEGSATSSLVAIADGCVAALGVDGSVRQIDVTGHWEYAGVLGPPPGSPLDLARSSFVDRVLALAFSPDGRWLATGGGEPSRSGELMLWDVESQTLVQTVGDAHSDTVQSVAFSHDGRVLASAAADKFARTFDVASSGDGHAVLIRSFEGHTDHVLGVALKADGTAIATAAADLTVKVWDSRTGEQQKTITGYGKQVTSLAYVGLSDQIVSSGGDKLVRLHTATSGKQERTFSGATDYVHATAVSSDGSTVVAGGDDGVLFVWDGETGKLLHQFAPPQPAGATAAR